MGHRKWCPLSCNPPDVERSSHVRFRWYMLATKVNDTCCNGNHDSHVQILEIWQIWTQTSFSWRFSRVGWGFGVPAGRGRNFVSWILLMFVASLWRLANVLWKWSRYTPWSRIYLITLLYIEYYVWISTDGWMDGWMGGLADRYSGYSRRAALALTFSRWFAAPLVFEIHSSLTPEGEWWAARSTKAFVWIGVEAIEKRQMVHFAIRFGCLLSFFLIIFGSTPFCAPFMTCLTLDANLQQPAKRSRQVRCSSPVMVVLPRAWRDLVNLDADIAQGLWRKGHESSNPAFMRRSVWPLLT